MICQLGVQYVSSVATCQLNIAAICQLSCSVSAQLPLVKQLSAQLPLVNAAFKSAVSSVAPCEIRCT